MFDSDEKQGPFAQQNNGAQTTGNYPGVNTSSTYSPKSPKLSPTSQGGPVPTQPHGASSEFRHSAGPSHGGFGGQS